MTKKSLQAWYSSGDISYSQKEIINKFGVGDYSPEYPLWDLKKLWYWNEILERNKQKLNISGQMTRMIFFSTWWNNNLIIVASSDKDKDNGAWSHLIAYEMPMQSGDVSTEFLRKLANSYGDVDDFYKKLTFYD